MISLAGVAIGVMVLVVVLSVFGGFENLLKDRVLSYTPHININRVTMWPDPELNPEYNAREEWRAVQDRMSSLPGVESAYALVNDFVLLDREGAIAPASMQAIDTENKQQLESLQQLIAEGSGSADMGLGENAVISSLTAEKFGLVVGDTIQVHTSRNLQQIRPVLDRIGTARYTERFPQALTTLIEELERITTSADKDTAPIEEFTLYYNQMLKPLAESPELRSYEHQIINQALDHFGSGERTTQKPDNSGQFIFPKGHVTAGIAILKQLKTADVEDADINDIKAMKTVVLPKDLKIIGIYQASRHTLSPDIFVPLNIGQDLTGLRDGVRGIALRLDDPYQAAQVLEKTILPNLGDNSNWEPRTWMQDHQQQFALISTQRQLLTFALAFIMLVSAFSIMAVMFTVTIQKKREIGVMKALGAAPAQLVRVFLYQGIIIGLFGGLIGLGLGYIVVENRQAILDFFADKLGFNPFPNDFNGFDGLPATYNPTEWVGVFLFAFLMCIIATLVPALAASRSDAAKSLRNI